MEYQRPKSKLEKIDTDSKGIKKYHFTKILDKEISESIINPLFIPDLNKKLKEFSNKKDKINLLANEIFKNYFPSFEYFFASSIFNEVFILKYLFLNLLKKF